MSKRKPASQQALITFCSDNFSPNFSLHLKRGLSSSSFIFCSMAELSSHSSESLGGTQERGGMEELPAPKSLCAEARSVGPALPLTHSKRCPP